MREDDLYDPFEESVGPAPAQSPAQSPAPAAGTPLLCSPLSTPSLSSLSSVSTFCQHGFQPAPDISQPSSRRKTSDEKLADFLTKGCGCRLECHKFFDAEHYRDVRDQCSTLTREELDLVLLGQIMANIHVCDVVGPQSKHAPSPRQRARLDFRHHGRKICKITHLVLHGVGKVPYYGIGKTT